MKKLAIIAALLVAATNASASMIYRIETPEGGTIWLDNNDCRTMGGVNVMTFTYSGPWGYLSGCWTRNSYETQLYWPENAKKYGLPNRFTNDNIRSLR